MSFLLASLFSKQSMSAGLMIYDVDRADICYLQLLDLSDLPLHMHQLRGISLYGNRLYVIVPCAMLIFSLTVRQSNIALRLEKTVCRPEWVLGRNQQADLHAVHVSPGRQRVYVSFNAQCAIDVFDLDGNHTRRRYLWEIAPNLFPRPTASIRTDFRYGVVRHMFESNKSGLLLTTNLLNGGVDSAVISYEQGSVVLSRPGASIHGGWIDDDRLYLCAIQDGEIQAFPAHRVSNSEDAVPLERYIPKLTDKKWHGSDQNPRGLAILDGRLFCGVCYFRKPKANQIPPRMVEFDLHNGQQVREHWLPSFEGLKDPHIYGLLPIEDELKEALTSKTGPVFYRGIVPFAPVWAVDAGADEDTSKKEASDEPTESEKVEDGPSASTQPEERERGKGQAGHAVELENQTLSTGKGPEPLNDGGELVTPETMLVAVPVVASDSKGSRSIGQPTVIFNQVGLCFERSARKFLSFNKTLRNRKKFWALREVSFTVHEGETLGVIGRNGSGKSTLSMICGGVLHPDRGDVIIHGRAQLLALGVGFKNELSGRENVYISASLLGLGKKTIQSMMNDIESFAELGEFMDEPVRTYSSGMRSRLGFAVATAVRPDILILDEIMATGDKVFKDKAMRRLRQMSDLARSVIVVSHNPGQLRKLSSRVLWLEKGRMVMIGAPKDVLNAYDHFCQNPSKWMANHPELAATIYPEGVRHE